MRIFRLDPDEATASRGATPKSHLLVIMKGRNSQKSCGPTGNLADAADGALAGGWRRPMDCSVLITSRQPSTQNAGISGTGAIAMVQVDQNVRQLCDWNCAKANGMTSTVKVHDVFSMI
jgi:hypothetical protein